MHSILEQFYNGNLCPFEHCRPFIPESKELREKHMEHVLAFEETLSPDQLKAYNQLWDELFDSLPYTACESYIRGFQTGARFMLEILTPIDAEA